MFKKRSRRRTRTTTASWLRLRGRPARPSNRSTGLIHYEGLRESYFHMKDSRGQVGPIPLNDRIGIAVEWLRQVYSVNTEDPVLNEDGTTRSFGDGVPNYVLHDYLTALEMCQLTGLVVFVQLDPRARRRLVANRRSVPVRIVAGRINTWVIDADNGLRVGRIAKHVQVQDGAYTMSAQGVVVVKRPTPNFSPPSRPPPETAEEVVASSAARSFPFALGGCRPPWERVKPTPTAKAETP